MADGSKIALEIARRYNRCFKAWEDGDGDLEITLVLATDIRVALAEFEQALRNAEAENKRLRAALEAVKSSGENDYRNRKSRYADIGIAWSAYALVVAALQQEPT